MSHALGRKPKEEGLKSIRALQKDFMEQNYAQIAATIAINEVAPRAKKLGVSFEQVISPQDLASLAVAEVHGINTRADTRKYLDILKGE